MMRVFIGSSSEQQRLVEWLTAFMLRQYSGVLEPVPWTLPWPGGRYTLENLLTFVEQTDAAILFWTADDKTWYRATERHEPRDNLVFEAGLFIAAHGRARTRLMVPSYPASDGRKSVAIPSDVAGMTWHPYAWKDGPPEATGLPVTARTVCDELKSLGPRPRLPFALQSLSGHRSVDAVQTFVGEWHSMNIDGIHRLASQPEARSIDILSAYRVGEIRRAIGAFKSRKEAHLRACFANMWNDELVDAYRRKYWDRDVDYIRGALEDSIRGLVGPCEISESQKGEVTIKSVATPPKASVEIRLTEQRITYGYYRIDDVAFVVPLEMKKSQEPAPLVWAVDRETMPRAFKYYAGEYDTVFGEARDVFPGQQ